MTISLTCPDCFQDYRVRDEFAGKRLKCKACGSTIHVMKPELAASEDDDCISTLSNAAQQEATSEALGGFDANAFPRDWGINCSFSGDFLKIDEGIPLEKTP